MTTPSILQVLKELVDNERAKFGCTRKCDWESGNGGGQYFKQVGDAVLLFHHPLQEIRIARVQRGVQYGMFDEGGDGGRGILEEVLSLSRDDYGHLSAWKEAERSLRLQVLEARRAEEGILLRLQRAGRGLPVE